MGGGCPMTTQGEPAYITSHIRSVFNSLLPKTNTGVQSYKTKHISEIGAYSRL